MRNEIRRIANDWLRLATVALAVACTSRTQPSVSAVIRPPGVVAGIIVRARSYIDADLAARRLGHLEVAVRSTDRPTQAVQGAQVLAIRSPHDTLRRVFVTDDHGVAKLDSLPIGEFLIRAKRIGYVPAVVSVAVVAGCRVDMELYVAPDAVGLEVPPRMPSRAAVTTCGVPQ